MWPHDRRSAPRQRVSRIELYPIWGITEFETPRFALRPLHHRLERGDCAVARCDSPDRVDCPVRIYAIRTCERWLGTARFFQSFCRCRESNSGVTVGWCDRLGLDTRGNWPPAKP